MNYLIDLSLKTASRFPAPAPLCRVTQMEKSTWSNDAPKSTASMFVTWLCVQKIVS